MKNSKKICYIFTRHFIITQKGKELILYNSKKKMIGASAEAIELLGYDTLEEFKENVKDIADFFINKPGYIYNFKNFSWIDYTLFNEIKSPKVILKGNISDIEVELRVRELIILSDNSKYYVIELHNIKTIEEAKAASEIGLLEEESAEETPEVTEFIEKILPEKEKEEIAIQKEEIEPSEEALSDELSIDLLEEEKEEEKIDLDIDIEKEVKEIETEVTEKLEETTAAEEEKFEIPLEEKAEKEEIEIPKEEEP